MTSLAVAAYVGAVTQDDHGVRSGDEPAVSEPRVGGILSAAAARVLFTVAGVIWVLPAVAVFFAVNLLPQEVPPGRCQGLGFGCTLAPNEQALMLGYFYCIWSIPIGIVVLTLTAAVLTSRRRPRAAR